MKIGAQLNSGGALISVETNFSDENEGKEKEKAGVFGSINKKKEGNWVASDF